MVATFNVVWDYGGTANTPGTTAETLTNCRFNAEDTNDQDTASPLTIVASTVVFSYLKHLYLKCSGAPSVQVDNVKLYTDGSLAWTGCFVYVANDTCTKNSGSSAGYFPAVTVGQATMITNHDTVTARTSLFTYTSGSAKTMAISESGSIINATNETTNYAVLQMTVEDTASPGTQATETVTWSYDEI